MASLPSLVIVTAPAVYVLVAPSLSIDSILYGGVVSRIPTPEASIVDSISGPDTVSHDANLLPKRLAVVGIRTFTNSQHRPAVVCALPTSSRPEALTECQADR